jgi:protocatechuate 3,4-dioxygenase beta subunit
MTEQPTDLSRRNFLQRASTAALILPGLGLGAVDLAGCVRQRDSFAQSSPAGKNDHDVSWKTVIVDDKEPGEPLIVSGTIYTPDGRTPMDGINLYVYQTDATGNYSTSGGDNRNTRIHGLMRTNAEGHYEFRTIKPASYPGRRIAAHIHAFVSGPGYPEYWIDEFIFEGDPFITEEVRQKFADQGNFSPILHLTRGSDGLLRGSRDIRIERCSRNCTGR